jgi:hypothetical protein
MPPHHTGGLKLERSFSWRPLLSNNRRNHKMRPQGKKLARPRTPTAKAKLEGRHIKNPQRYKRNEPTASVLGNPPTWLSETQAEAWREFEAELPWLNHSHRCIVGIASVLRSRLQSGVEVGTKALSLLRLCLSSMGATPAGASKIGWAPEEDPDDLLD